MSDCQEKHAGNSDSCSYWVMNPGDYPLSVTTRPRASALPMFLLLISMAIVAIGCGNETGNQIMLPKNPAPLPDPSSRVEINESITTPPGVTLEKSK